MKIKYLLSGFISSVCLFFVAGCSTIVHGTRQDVLINSTPSGAEVMLNGQQKRTPAVFKVKGSPGYSVVANKEGYKTAYGYVDSDFRIGTTVFGNILWLIPGLIVDFVTGSAYEMQKQIDIPMQKSH